jgi:hypothetical protein
MGGGQGVSTANENGASVLFVADSTTLTRPDHPVLVVDLLDDDRRPFRCIPPELWGIDNNLNIANMDWAEFADAVDENGVFRGFPRSLLRVPGSPVTAQRQMRALISGRRVIHRISN